MSNFVYKPLDIFVTNAQPGQIVRLAIHENGVNVGFSAGEPLSQFGGMEIRARGGEMPLQVFHLDQSLINIAMASGSGGSGPIDFSVSLSLAAEPGISSFYLSSTSSPGVIVEASVSSAQSQPVNQSPTLFNWP